MLYGNVIFIYLPELLKATMRHMRDMKMGGMVRMAAAARARQSGPLSTHTEPPVLCMGLMLGLSNSVPDTSITNTPVEVKVSLRMSGVTGAEIRS